MVSREEVFTIIRNNVRNKYKSWTDAEVLHRTHELMEKRYPKHLPKEKFLYNGKANVLMQSIELPSLTGKFILWIDSEFMLLEVKGNRIACNCHFWEAAHG